MVQQQDRLRVYSMWGRGDVRTPFGFDQRHPIQVPRARGVRRV